MLNKFSDNYTTAFHKLSFEEQQEIVTIFFTMFYGDREELISGLTQFKEQSYSDQEISEILEKRTNLEFFFNILETLQLENITGLIKTQSSLHKSGDEVLNLITDQQGLKKMMEMQNPFAHYIFKTVFGLDLQGKTGDECKELTKTLVYVTKETIAKEFGCNKRTLSKWLRIHFGDRFSRNDRKIAINEYIEIFEAFFLSNTENLDLNNDLDKYLKRIEKGMSFGKSELAELCSSDLKTQKQSLRKIAFYSSINKFPYAILKNWAGKMGSEPEF